MSTSPARILLSLAAVALAACASTQEAPRKLPPMSFSGVEAASTDRLRNVVADEVGEVAAETWERSAVDDGAFAIERWYKSEGFAFTLVEWEIVPGEDGRARAHFKVEEGPRISLESLRFEGVTAFDAQRIASYFPPMPRSTPVVLGDEGEPRPHRGGSPWWVESQLASAAGDLEDLYYKNGYLEARVAKPVSTLDDEKHGARVVVQVHEGVRSRLTRIEVRGAPPIFEQAVQQAADSFLDRPYSPLVTGAVRARLEHVLATHGYPDARAELEGSESAADGATRISIAIEPGVLVRIKQISIRGHKRMRRSSVISFLVLRPGDVYNADKERESFRNLYQSGLFSSVRVALAPGDERERDLVVELAEGHSIEIYGEPGYGSYEGLRFTAGLRYKNVFGTGRTLDLKGSVSELAQSGRISVITPNVFGTHMRSTTSLFANRREEPTFTSNEAGIGWYLYRRISKRLSATLGYEFRSTEVEDVDVIGPQVQALIDAVEISSVSLSPTWDTRDSVFVPTRGGLSKATLEFASSAIGSELDFARMNFAHSTYLRPWLTDVIALSWRTGVIVPIQNTDDIPLQERYFNGGENTVRSFSEDQLGPTDAAGTPVGGEVYNVLSAELRHKLRGNLDGALFYDVGNVQLDYQDWFELSGYRSAVGVGLRYVLPIGPMRLDYGINPEPRGSESASVLHFAVGMAF